MRRYIRLAWIVVLNTYVISIHAGLLHEKWQLYHLLQAKPPWRNFIAGSVGIFILIAGILCEIFRLATAKYINMGYFFVVGTFYTSVGMIGHHEPEAWIFFPQVGLPALVVGLVTLALYWKRNIPDVQSRLKAAEAPPKP